MVTKSWYFANYKLWENSGWEIWMLANGSTWCGKETNACSLKPITMHTTYSKTKWFAQ
jgi:hypothetical protein